MSMDSILTPSEMDALLQPSEADVGAAPQDVRPLDLITRDHQAFALLPQLNEAGKSLAAHVGRICSQQLRMPCQAEPSAVEVMPASRLEDMVGSPRFTYSVKANGRSGAGALTIDGLLGAAFVERQFGGDINDLQDPGGAPSPTEQRAVGRLASYVVLAFQKVLSDLTAMELELEYFPPSLLGQMTQGVSVVHLTMKISLESHECFIAVALDTSAAGFKQAGPPVRFSPKDGPLSAALLRVPVTVSAVLGRAQLSLSRLTELAPGDLLPLDTFGTGEAEFLIEGQAKFTGSPTVHRGVLSLRLEEHVEE